jgi:hypothetical protein
MGLTTMRRGANKGQLSDRDLREFIRWEETARGIVVERALIHLIGDLAGGVLLSQILSCWLGKGDCNRIERDGRLWLCKERAGWADITCLKPKQFDRCLAKLEDVGLIVTAVFGLNGVPTKFISLNLTRLSQQLSSRHPGDASGGAPWR